MAYTKKITENYGTRLKKSLLGIITGCVIFITGTVLLFWNEGNSVKNHRDIREISEAVEEADISVIDAGLDGRLIHASGRITTNEILTDSLFGTWPDAVKLLRKVEYYQWVEKEESQSKDRAGGSKETVTVYTCEKQWVETPVPSENFNAPKYRHANRVLVHIENREEVAAMNLGAYTLPDFLKASVSEYIPADIHLTPMQTGKLENLLDPDLAGNRKHSCIHTYGNRVYLGLSPDSPNIGDIRIFLTRVPPDDVSIIAKIKGDTFEPYRTKNGSEFSSIQPGVTGKEEMLEPEYGLNTAIAWFLRLVGLFLVVAGLYLSFNILPTLFQLIPAIANIVNLGVTLVCIIVGLSWSLLVIVIAWLYFHPLFGIGLPVSVFCGIWLFKFVARKKRMK